MPFGDISKNLTLIALLLIIPLMLVLGYLSLQRSQLECKLLIDESVATAISNERKNFEEIENAKSKINSFDDVAIDKWLRSNGGYR